MAHWDNLEKHRKSALHRYDARFKRAMSDNWQTINRLKREAFIDAIDRIVMSAISIGFIFHRLGGHHDNTNHDK